MNHHAANAIATKASIAPYNNELSCVGPGVTGITDGLGEARGEGETVTGLGAGVGKGLGVGEGLASGEGVASGDGEASVVGLGVVSASFVAFWNSKHAVVKAFTTTSQPGR